MSRQSHALRQPPASVQVSSARKRRPTRSVSCNHPRCRKPVSATVFVCACDCLFCEECTYNHFNTSSNCPVCNRTLTESDFMEVNVTDPPDPSRTSKNSAIRNLFMTQNANAPSLTFQDMCTRSMKLTDECRDSYKFLMKQFLLDTSQMTQRMQHSQKVVAALQEQIRVLKHAKESDKQRIEQAMDDLRDKNTSLQKKIAEKERQVAQFRKLHSSMVPASPHNASYGSDDNVRHSDAGGLQQPPLRGFMRRKEAQDAARERMLLGQSSLKTPRLGLPAVRSSGSHGSHPEAYYPAQSAAGHPLPSVRRDEQSKFGKHTERSLKVVGGRSFDANSRFPPAHPKRRRSEPTSFAGQRLPKKQYTPPPDAFINQSTSHHARMTAYF